MKKTLLLLLLLLLALGGIAFWMTQSQSGISTVQESGERLLPELDLNEIASIDILSPDGTNTVENRDGQWVLPSLNGYPANTDKIAEEINKLDEMKVGQSVRGGEALYEDLELSDDKSTRLILKDKDGKELTTVYLGATREKEQQGNPQFGGGSFNVPDGQYVRVGDDGIVLTKDAIQGFDNVSETWVEKEIANVAKTDMKEATVSTTNGTYTLAAVGTEDYFLEGLRKGQEIDNSRAYSVLNALSYLNFSSVAGKDLDPAKTGLDRAQSFAGTTTKGLVYNIKVGGKDDKGDSYISIDAAAAPSDADDADDTIKTEVEAFNKKHQGWVYTVSSFKADAFVKPLSELVKLQPETPASSDAGGNNPGAALAPSGSGITAGPIATPGTGATSAAAGTPAAGTPAAGTSAAGTPAAGTPAAGISGGPPVPAPVAIPPSIAKPAGSETSVSSPPLSIGSASGTPAETTKNEPAPSAPGIASGAAKNGKPAKNASQPATSKATTQGQADGIDFDALRAELKGLKSAVRSADKTLDSIKRKNRNPRFNRHPQARQLRQCQEKNKRSLDDILSGLAEETEAEKPGTEKPAAKRKDRPAKAKKPGKKNVPATNVPTETVLPNKAAPPPTAPPAKAAAAKKPKSKPPAAKTSAEKPAEKPVAKKPVAAKPAGKKADAEPTGKTKIVPPPLDSKTTTFDPDIPLARSYPLGTKIAPAPWEEVDEKEYILGTVTKAIVDDGGPPVVQTIPLDAEGDGKAAPARPAAAPPAARKVVKPGTSTGTKPGSRDPNLRLYNAPPGPRNPNIPIAPSRPFLR